MTIQSLWDLIEAGASQVPSSKTAVWSSDGSSSYGQLMSHALGIAATLHESRIGRGDRVGIWMEKTPECVEAILGVLASGAAYVPLDARAPWRRCRTIAMDCGFRGLIADEPRLPFLSSLLEGAAPRRLLLHASSAAIAGAELPKTLSAETLTDARSAPPRDLGKPCSSDLAYILYTSGSTGTPKGVIHTHASGLAFTEWVQQRFGILATDIFSSHAPLHFDLSILDLYASLGSGASVRLISSLEGMLAPYLVKLITDSAISVWYSVPSILISMLDVGNLERQGLPTVRILFFAGEVFPTAQLRRLRRAMPNAALYNLFGPTETNVCTYYELPPDLPDERTAPIPIGRVCEHLEAFVLDETGREAGPEREGVLWVKGGNLMSGYWNDPSRTIQSLLADPRDPARPGLAYSTGDYVKLVPDGNYEFLGRRDHMFKIRGFRVELSEIETILTSHPGVLEAAALVLPDAALGNRIVASVVPRSGEQLDSNQVRAHCSRFLPSYMVPDEIEIRSTLDRTSTGKADRQTLYQHWQARQNAANPPSRSNHKERPAKM